jgi:PD-(D/E)XK nuclease superfamily/Domain of unknown function (DUF2357)
MALLTIPLDSVPGPLLIEEHQPVELLCAVPAGAQASLTIDGVPLDPFLHPGDPAWRWRWNPGAAAGRHQLTLAIDARRTTHVIEVLPAKLDGAAYDALIDDLRHIAHDLVLLIGGGQVGAQGRRAEGARPLRLTDYYSTLDQQLVRFERAARQIARQPRERLITTRDERPVDRASAAVSPPSVEQVVPTPATLAPEVRATVGDLLPAMLQERAAAPSLDTYEHRLLKRTTQMLLRRAQQLAEIAASDAGRAAGAAQRAELVRIEQGAVAAQRRLRALRELPLLQAAGDLESYRGPTPLLQREPPYRELLRTFLALRQVPQLDLASSLFQLPIAELPRLYELWCALQVAYALASRAAPHDQQLIAERDALAHVALQPGTVLTCATGEWGIRLRYQPRYAAAGARRQQIVSLDRHTRVPDLALEASGPQGEVRLLIFDAKYRLDHDRRSAPQDALAEAYAYHAAIGVAGRPCVDDAYILYPGTGERERYPGGAGAIPLLPGSAAQLDLAVAEWLDGLSS